MAPTRKPWRCHKPSIWSQDRFSCTAHIVFDWLRRSEAMQSIKVTLLRAGSQMEIWNHLSKQPATETSPHKTRTFCLQEVLQINAPQSFELPNEPFSNSLVVLWAFCSLIVIHDWGSHIKKICPAPRPASFLRCTNEAHFEGTTQYIYIYIY